MLDEIFTMESIPKALGIVLDISLKHKGDVRRIDLVKQAINAAVLHSLDYYDPVYICTNADRDGFPSHSGEGLAKMADFDIPVTLDIAPLFQHTVHVIGQSDFDHKYIVFVTDRYLPRKESGIGLALNINKRLNYKCKILLISVGGKYSNEMAKLLEYDPDALINDIELEDLFTTISLFLSQT